MDTLVSPRRKHKFNPLTGALKPQSNGIYTVIRWLVVFGILAVDKWALGTARRGLGGPQLAEVPPRCIKCNSPPCYI